MKNVYFISHRISIPLTGGEKLNDALLESLKNNGARIDCWETYKLPGLVKFPLFLNFYFLYKILFANKKSILMLDIDYHSRYFLILPLAKYLKKMTIVVILYHYSYILKENLIFKNVQYQIEKAVSRSSDFIITISQYSAECFKSMRSSKNKDIFIIQPFVNLTPVSYKHFSGNKILFVGNVEPRKNIENTLFALSRLNIKFEFNVVGGFFSTEYKEYIEQLVKKLNLDHCVNLHGRTSNELLQRLYAESSLFILVSRLEGFGIVYAEAMQHGLPIIGSTEGAVPEIVLDGINGITCKPDDVLQISNAIERLLTDHVFWEHVSKNNIEKSKTFNSRLDFISKSNEIFQKIYTDISK